MIQCSNCGFENPDGSLRCARCRTIIDTSGIRSVIPPRSPFANQKRRPWFFRRSTYRTRYAARRSLVIQAGASFFIPGLGQVLVGETLKGLALLTATLVFAVLAYPFRGGLSNLFLMLAFFFHGYSISDSLRQLPEMRRIGYQFLLGFLIVLSLSIYYRGVSRLFSLNYELITVISDQFQPVFRRNDAVMINRAAYRVSEPRRGDIVCFTGPHGRTLERILAQPGDLAEVRNGELFINNEPVEKNLYPLEKTALPEGYRQEIPKNNCLLLDSVHYGGHEGAANSTATLSLVPEGSIIGRVISIWNPGLRVRFP